jgi:LysR family transcriptional regulator, low CO2-responsive transcriptional regulator
MTLTQLSAFVLVARLGSVSAAAAALGVSEPAVSQALAALRQHLGDRLLTRGPGGMTLTAGGSRLLPIASQMVSLGADAEAAVRAARGAPEQLRVVATSPIAEFLATPLVDAFTRRAAGVEATCDVATSVEMPVLVLNRLADLALGPPPSGAAARTNLSTTTGGRAPAESGSSWAINARVTARRSRSGSTGRARPGPAFGPESAAELVSEPIFRCQVIVVASPEARLRGSPAQWPWLVDPSGADPGSDTSGLLGTLDVPESRVQVFPNQTAAWAAAASGAGAAPAFGHLVSAQLRRGELVAVETPATPAESIWHVTSLRSERRPPAASALWRFLGTPEGTHLMKMPSVGVPPSRFRPPVYVTIWS